MANRTQTYTKLPWSGGINSSVDPGVLNDDELVLANNVLFSSSGSRIKREGFDYLDADIPDVAAYESSGTTKTLYFEEQVYESGVNEILITGERLYITGSTNYNTDSATITSITSSTQSNTLTTTGVTASTQDGKYFSIQNADGLIGYWFDVDNNGTAAPISAGGLYYAVYEITGVNTGDSAGAQATAIGAAINASGYFTASVLSNVVTISMNAAGFPATPSTAISYLHGVLNNNTNYAFAGVSAGTTFGKVVYTGSVSNTDTLSAQNTIITAARGSDILALVDYWRTNTSNEKEQVVVTMTDQGHLFTTDLITGYRVNIAKHAAATAIPTTPLSKVSWRVFNESLIFAMDGANNHMIKYNPDTATTWQDLGGTPPKASIIQEHLGRLWCNDKTDLDRLHYSETIDAEVWNGTGDSGALDIGTGDGDSAGITAIFPPFKGRLIVAKGKRLYQIIGEDPETFQVVPITSGVGAESHNAVAAIDQDDLVFISRKGIHSLAATASHGDFEGAFLSTKIQPTFNEFQKDHLQYSHAQYVPELNSICFAVTDGTTTDNQTMYLYNTVFKTWYCWPEQSCMSLSKILINNEDILCFGTNRGRIVRTQTGEYADFGSTATPYQVYTGTIYPGGNPNSIKAFKRISFLFRPLASYSFTCYIKIDNQDSQTLTFTQTNSGDVLDVDFYLGVSYLGGANVLAPESRVIDGIGRGLTIDIRQETADQQVEIYGYIIEYQELNPKQEVIAPT